jgi:hypothetical protein
MWDKWQGGFEEQVIQLTGIENVQFNVVLDEGSKNGMVQFNDMPVNDSRKGFRVGGLQFNGMLVVDNEGNEDWEEWVGASNDEWKKFLVGMVIDRNMTVLKSIKLSIALLSTSAMISAFVWYVVNSIGISKALHFIIYIVSILRTLAKAASLGPSKNLVTVVLLFLELLLFLLHPKGGPYLGSSFECILLWGGYALHLFLHF